MSYHVGSSSSSSSTGSSSSPSSYSASGLAENNDAFLKVKDGVNAPEGFHYMPNGKLMSDADHIAVNGYAKKTITSVNLDYSDIAPTGGLKTITILGDAGMVFSIEVYEGNRANYYNFKTRTWGASSHKLTNVSPNANNYTVNVIFPAQSSLKTMTINVYAETVENIKTQHTPVIEERFEDGSLNFNASSGSDSNIITKTLYQDVIKNLTLSTFAPSKSHSSTGTTNGAVSSNRMIIDEDATDPNIVEIGDLISCTGIAPGLGVLVTKINPDGDNIHEIEMSAADTVSDGVTVTFFPAFRGLTPNNIDSTTGRMALEVVSGSSTSVGFLITLTAFGSRGFSQTRLPTTEDLCFINPVTFGSAALPITGEDISGSTFYRWPVTNIANLANGMALDPSRSSTGANTTTPAFISGYSASKTLQRINNSNRYHTEIEDYNEQDSYIAGVDSAGNIAATLDRNGRVTARAGNIVFDVQQADALKADADVLVIAQGAEAILQATGMGVSISDTTITPTQVSTTTTAASSASTTIALTEVGNVLVGQTVRGVGINAAVANPTVVSKSVATGGGNIVVTSAQTIEDGATLFFDGPSNELLMRGIITVTNMPIVDTNLFFNVEGFLNAG
tara:strand:+ start:2060 stop:3919 length:1860 start_codon:yes stop_codon:yes gene_type:complete